MPVISPSAIAHSSDSTCATATRIATPLRVLRWIGKIPFWVKLLPLMLGDPHIPRRLAQPHPKRIARCLGTTQLVEHTLSTSPRKMLAAARILPSRIRHRRAINRLDQQTGWEDLCTMILLMLVFTHITRIILHRVRNDQLFKQMGARTESCHLFRRNIAAIIANP